MVAESYPSWADRARACCPTCSRSSGSAWRSAWPGLAALAADQAAYPRLEPAEIAALADQREALLHSIREGVVAVADDGTVTVLSDSARELIGLDGDVEGRKVDDLDLGPGVRARCSRTTR